MPLRVDDITNIPELRTRFLAGSEGGARMVRWAHVCELPNPSDWLGEGELLMTTGMGIPEEPSKQEKYIEDLDQAGLAGVMIGENMKAPKDLSALENTAERLGFPVLLTEYGVPFSSVTRAIIDAGKKEDFDRKNAINRVFESARMAIAGLSLEELLQRLAKDINAELRLMDLKDHEKFWLPRGHSIPLNLKEAIRAQPLIFSETQQVVKRYILEDGDVFAVSVPSRRPSVLLVRNAESHLLEYSLLNHIVSILGISIERLYVDTERSLRLGSQLLDDLMSSRLSPYEAGKQMQQFKLNIDSACLAILRPKNQDLAEWSMKLGWIEAPVLIRPQGDELILLVHTNDVPVVQEIIGDGVGYSNPVGFLERLPEALREARLAYVHAGESRLVAYADISDKVPWLPDNLNEAAQTFQKIMGPLVDYEVKNGTPLLYTLKVFLEENRSWLIAAKQLHIHKTTLIYRVKKIESVTGRSLDRTEDVAILWMALRAGEIAGMVSSNTRRTVKLQN
ncbi:PucR family transcriptional regulator ligand-binding domain-containing protein [Aquabacterium sp. G14]|uniref:PucR family transcriptional regulator n=1 Tax=Aquabacterium sp. G14 TaxID=3130164 RepID=UPI0030ADE46A